MRDLHHQRGAVRVNALREPLQVRNDRVGADIELPEDIGRIRTSTLDDPPNIVSAMPPLAFSS